MIVYLNHLKKVILYFGYNKIRLLFGFLQVILLTIITIPVPIIIGKVIDFIIIDNQNELKKLMIILFIIYLFKYILSITNDFNFNKIKEDINIKSKTTLLNFIMNMSMENLNNFEKGELLSKFNECQQIQNLFNKTYLNGLISIFEIIIMIVIMFRIDIRLSIIACLFIPVYYIFSRKSSKQMKEMANQNLQSAATVNSEIYEMLNNIEKIKISNTITIHINDFSQKNKEYDKKTRRLNNTMSVFMENFSLISNMNNYLLLLASIIHGIRSLFFNIYVFS